MTCYMATMMSLAFDAEETSSGFYDVWRRDRLNDSEKTTTAKTIPRQYCVSDVLSIYSKECCILTHCAWRSNF